MSHVDEHARSELSALRARVEQLELRRQETSSSAEECRQLSDALENAQLAIERTEIAVKVAAGVESLGQQLRKALEQNAKLRVQLARRRRR